MSQVTGSDPHHSSVVMNHLIITKQRAPFMEKCFTHTYDILLIFFTAKGLHVVCFYKGKYKSPTAFEISILGYHTEESKWISQIPSQRFTKLHRFVQAEHLVLIIWVFFQAYTHHKQHQIGWLLQRHLSDSTLSWRLWPSHHILWSDLAHAETHLTPLNFCVWQLKGSFVTFFLS